MEVLGFILGFVIVSFFVGTALWLGLKVTKVEGTFLGMLIIAVVTTLIGLIPGIGWILSLVALYFMLHRWTTAEYWPDAGILVATAAVMEYVIAIPIAILLVALGMAGS
jgi:hypothetical protein